jgi:hypothetical protein
MNGERYRVSDAELAASSTSVASGRTDTERAGSADHLLGRTNDRPRIVIDFSLALHLVAQCELAI